MNENYRRLEVKDPYGRTFTVEYRWQQTAISIRHSDTVDVKFQLISGEDVSEKIVALPNQALLTVAQNSNRAVTDAWCMKLAALHVRRMIETDRDMEKTLVTVSFDEIERYSQSLEQTAESRR